MQMSTYTHDTHAYLSLLALNFLNGEGTNWKRDCWYGTGKMLFSWKKLIWDTVRIKAMITFVTKQQNIEFGCRFAFLLLICLLITDFFPQKKITRVRKLIIQINDITSSLKKTFGTSVCISTYFSLNEELILAYIS